jgi:hypothetical protein
MPMAEDDEGNIKERLFLSKDKPDLLQNEMTAIDNSPLAQRLPNRLMCWRAP